MGNDHDILDLRGTGEDELGSRFLDFFAELEPGSAVQVSCDKDHSLLLQVLEKARAGEFEWWPLETGPVVWRVVVGRRKQTGKGLTVEELFAKDHRRMREILEESRKAVDAGDRQLAARHFADLSVGIARHVRGEERILFPIFHASGLKEVEKDLRELSHEHREILSLLDQILELFGAEERFDQPLVEETMRAMWTLMQTHEDREERIFLPLCDRLLTDSERERALGSAREL